MSEIQGDPVLAKIFADSGTKPEPSRIVATDYMATAFNRDRLGARMTRRIAELSCGHKVVARTGRRTMTCPRCIQLMKHGFDYEGWLRGVSPTWPFDGMHWRADPCRIFNEPTDLEGRFITDPEETRP